MLVIKNQIKTKFRLLKILFISLTLLNFISCSRKPNLTSFLDQPNIQSRKLELKEDSVLFTPQQTTEQEHWSPWKDYSYTVRACFEKANIEDSIEYIEGDFKIINTASNEELNLKMEKENDKICLTWDEKFTYNRLATQSQENQTNETIIEMKREIIYKQNTQILFFYFNLNNKQILKSNEISQTLSDETPITEEAYLNNLEDQEEKFNIQSLLKNISFKASFGPPPNSSDTLKKRTLELEIYTKIEEIMYTLNFGTYSLTVKKAGAENEEFCLLVDNPNCTLEFSLNGTQGNIDPISITEPNPGDEINIILTPSDQDDQSETPIQITQTFVKQASDQTIIFKETDSADNPSIGLVFDDTSTDEPSGSSETDTPQSVAIATEFPETIELTYFIQPPPTLTRIPDSFCNQASQFSCEKKMRIKHLSLPERLSLPDGNYCFRIGSYYKFQNNNTFQLEEKATAEGEMQIKNIESDIETATKTTDYKEFITFTKQNINITDGDVENEPEITYNNQKKPHPDPNQDLKFFLHFTEGDCKSDSLTDLDPNTVYWETEIKKQDPEETILTKASEKLSDDGHDKIITLEKGNQPTDIEITRNPFKESKKLEFISRIESELNSRQYLMAQFLESNKLKYLKNSKDDQTTLKALKDDCLISFTEGETNTYKETNTLPQTIRDKITGCEEQTYDFYLSENGGIAPTPIFKTRSDDDWPLVSTIDSFVEATCTLLFDSFNNSLKALLNSYGGIGGIGSYIHHPEYGYALLYSGEPCENDTDASSYTKCYNSLDKKWFKEICKEQFNKERDISKTKSRAYKLFYDPNNSSHNPEYNGRGFNKYFAFTTEKKIILNENNLIANSNLTRPEEIKDFLQLKKLYVPFSSLPKSNPILYFRPQQLSYVQYHRDYITPGLPFYYDQFITSYFTYFNNRAFNKFYKELNNLFLKGFKSFENIDAERNFPFKFLNQTNFNFTLNPDQYTVCWIFKLNKLFMLNLLSLTLVEAISKNTALFEDREPFKGNGFVYCPEARNQPPLNIEEIYYTMTFNEKKLNIRNTDTMKMLQMIETLYNQTKSNTTNTCLLDSASDSNNIIDSFFNHIQNIQNDYNQQSAMVLDAQFTRDFFLTLHLNSESEKEMINSITKTPTDTDFLLDLNDLSNPQIKIEDSTNCPNYEDWIEPALIEPALFEKLWDLLPFSASKSDRNNEICLLTTYRKFLSLPLPLPNSQNMLSSPP